MNKANFIALLQLTRLNRPIGIYLVLWPALWALVLASDGLPAWKFLVIFTVGAVVMRSAGCVINDFADRNIDGHVTRTCQRPLATGAINEKQALLFFVLLCLIGFGLVLLLNTLTIWLSLGAVLLSSLYPFMKRHTYWPQAFLGAAFAWAIPMAFSAVQNQVPWQAWSVFFVTMVWALVYDTAYALADKEDDLKIGVKSTAILFGRYVNRMIGFFQLLMVGLLYWVGHLFSLGLIYQIGLVIVAGWFVYHQYLLSKQTPQLAFKVFLNNHWVGLVILLATLTDRTWPL